MKFTIINFAELTTPAPQLDGSLGGSQLGGPGKVDGHTLAAEAPRPADAVDVEPRNRKVLGLGWGIAGDEKMAGK